MNKQEKLTEATMLALQGKLQEETEPFISASIYYNPRATVELNSEQRKLYKNLKDKANFDPYSYKAKLLKLAIFKGLKEDALERLATYEYSDDIVEFLDLVAMGTDVEDAFNKVDNLIAEREEKINTQNKEKESTFLNSLPEDVKELYNMYISSDKYTKEQKKSFKDILESFKLYDVDILNRIIDTNIDEDKIYSVGSIYSEGTYDELQDDLWNKDLLPIQYYCLSKALMKGATPEDLERIRGNEFDAEQLWKLYDRLYQIKKQSVTDTLNKLK